MLLIEPNLNFPAGRGTAREVSRQPWVGFCVLLSPQPWVGFCVLCSSAREHLEVLYRQSVIPQDPLSGSEGFGLETYKLNLSNLLQRTRPLPWICRALTVLFLPASEDLESFSQRRVLPTLLCSLSSTQPWILIS